jgi:hypothetical protein
MLTWNGCSFSLFTGRLSQRFCIPDLGGSRQIQALSELLLQFFALSLCCLEREKKKKKERK